MADKKTQLLEEAAVRNFMKIAGTSKLADGFVKKSKLLKEEDTGRGRVYNPHGDDPRHENLNEEDVTEEGKDLEKEGQEVTEEGLDDLEEEVQEEGEVQEEAVGSIVAKGPGKAIESGKGLSGAGKKPTAKVQYEVKGALTPKGPGKTIESGKGLSGAGKKPTAKVQYESEVAEEGEKLEEFGDPALGGEEEIGAEPPMPPTEEPPMGGEGGVDLQALVGAIAQAITQSTGVQVSVEGGEGDLGGEEELPPADDLGGEIPPETEEPPMQETGMVGYKTQDPKAARMSSGQMQEAKRLHAKKLAAQSAKRPQTKQELVEAITKKVLAKLSAVGAKKVAQTAKPVVKQPAKQVRPLVRK